MIPTGATHFRESSGEYYKTENGELYYYSNHYNKWCSSYLSNRFFSTKMIKLNEVNMNQDISKLEQQLAETKKQIEQLEQQLNEAKKPKQWEPKGGEYYISSAGLVCQGRSMDKFRNFGSERPTGELAEKAQEAMRVHNRLLAYVHEFAPDYVPDFSDTSCKFFVMYDNGRDKWVVDYSIHINVLGASYMPHSIAHDLVRKLNSGEVVL